MTLLDDYNAWIQGVFDVFFHDFGTTSFFTNPYAAQTWVMDNLRQNPTLSPTELLVMETANENAINHALNQTNDPELAALIYWEQMQIYVALNIDSPKLQNVFDTGVQAAKDTYNLTYDEGVPKKLEIPWWLILIPIIFIWRR